MEIVTEITAKSQENSDRKHDSRIFFVEAVGLRTPIRCFTSALQVYKLYKIRKYICTLITII